MIDILLISSVLILIFFMGKIAIFVYLLIKRLIDKDNEDFEKRDY